MKWRTIFIILFIDNGSKELILTSDHPDFNTIITNRLRTLVQNLITTYSWVLQLSVPDNSTDCMQSIDLSAKQSFLCSNFKEWYASQVLKELHNELLLKSGLSDIKLQYRTKHLSPRIEMFGQWKNSPSTTLSCKIGPILKKYSAHRVWKFQSLDWYFWSYFSKYSTSLNTHIIKTELVQL